MVSDMVQNSSIKNLSLSTNLDQDQAIFDATFSETIQGQALYRLRFNDLKTCLSQDSFLYHNQEEQIQPEFVLLNPETMSTKSETLSTKSETLSTSSTCSQSL